MEQSEKTIFVAIGAYNEPDLRQTIENCIEMAKYPSRLRFGVWSHNSDGVIPSLNDIPNVKLITAQFPTQLGVCPSRIAALFLYNNEDYYLQIDAHMLFQKDWDEIAINHYLNIKQKHDKPILTTYVPWWARNFDGSLVYYSPEINGQVMPLEYYDDGVCEIPMQRYISIDWSQQEEQYYEHYGLSAHFVFTSSTFIKDVFPDVEIMFYGEEPTTAMRAWTRGYRMFAVPDPIVWHFNKGYEDGPQYEFDRHQSYGDNQIFEEYYVPKERRAWLKARDILLGKTLGYWGAPDLESLKEYHRVCGFDFIDFYEKNADRLTN